jgi:hypothetical protein
MMSNLTLDFNLFLKDSKNTLLNPKSYFSNLKLSGGMAEPLIKAIVYGFVTGLIYLFCYLLKIKALGAGYIGEAVGLLAFIKIIFGAVLGLFFGAVILLIISSICRGITDFEANLRVVSSVMAVIPLYSILSLLWTINVYFGMVISLIVFIYFLWLLYHGLVDALKCKQENARIVSYVLTGLMILFLLLNVRTSGNRNDLKKDTRKNVKEFKK